MTRLFDLDMQLVHDTLLMALSVGALFLALSYLLFDPVRALLADRQQRIAQELEGAKAQMEEAREQMCIRDRDNIRLSWDSCTNSFCRDRRG